MIGVLLVGRQNQLMLLTTSLLTVWGYLRHVTSIMDVLKRYGVDYVATGPRVQAESCYLTSEPSQAGDDSFKLKSRVCAPVVDTFTLDGYATVVFRTNK